MPEAVLAPGLELIRWLVAHRSPGVDAFLLVVSDLGSTAAYVALVPILWWAVSWKLGARVFVALVLSVSVNALVKEAVALPRPFVTSDVAPLRTPVDYSFPSGHAQAAAVVWTLLALHVRKRRFTLGAAAVVLLIGFSRVYLAVHYPSDVLAGWLLGVGIALGFARFSAPVAFSLRRAPLGIQLGLAIGAPAALALLLPAPGTAMALGGLAGALGGLAYAYQHGLYPEGITARSRRPRSLVGLLGLPLLYLALWRLSPRPDSTALLFFRFAAIGLWVSFLVPRLVELVTRDRGQIESPP